MKRLRLLLDEGQWAIFRGILEEEGIRFTAINEQFSSLYPGPSVGAFQREVFIEDENLKPAKQLLEDFLNSHPLSEPSEQDSEPLD